jgi:hypothetical protein
MSKKYCVILSVVEIDDIFKVKNALAKSAYYVTGKRFANLMSPSYSYKLYITHSVMNSNNETK